MTKDECWQKFSQSGRITDYLAYVGKRDEAEGKSNPYAGFDKRDGDDFKIGTYR